MDRAIGVLRAEVGDLELIAAERAPIVAFEQAKTAIILQAEAGRIAPLEWLRAHSRYAVVPPQAVYRAECSRVLTRQGSVTAVFTFGLPAGALGRKVLEKDPDAFESFAKGMATMDERGRAALQNTRKFYSARNIRYEGNTAAYTHSFTTPDETLAIAFREISGFTNGPCAALPTGPLIMIMPGTNEAALYGGASSAQTTAAPANAAKRRFSAALNRAGLSLDEYRAILSNLKVARQMALIPNFIDEMEAVQSGVGTDPSAPDLKPIFRNNIRIYTQNKAVLDPLLEKQTATVDE